MQQLFRIKLKIMKSVNKVISMETFVNMMFFSLLLLHLYFSYFDVCGRFAIITECFLVIKQWIGSCLLLCDRPSGFPCRWVGRIATDAHASIYRTLYQQLTAELFWLIYRTTEWRQRSKKIFAFAKMSCPCKLALNGKKTVDGPCKRGLMVNSKLYLLTRWIKKTGSSENDVTKFITLQKYKCFTNF